MSQNSRDALIEFGDGADEEAQKEQQAECDRENEDADAAFSSTDRRHVQSFEDILLESRVRVALTRLMTKRKIKFSDATLERHGLQQVARHRQLERTNSVPGKQDPDDVATTPVRTHDHFLFKGEEHPVMQVRRMSMANLQVNVGGQSQPETEVSPAKPQSATRVLPSPATSRGDGTTSVADSANSVLDFFEATDRAKYSLMVEKDREVYLERLKSVAKKKKLKQRKASEYWDKMMDFVQRDEPAIATPLRPSYPTRQKPKAAGEEEEGRFHMAPLQKYFAGIKQKRPPSNIKSQEPSIPTPELLDWRTDMSFLK